MGLLSFMARKAGGRGKTLIQQSRGVSSADKAAWNEADGKTLRPFFGLNAADEAAIAQRISDGLDQQLKE